MFQVSPYEYNAIAWKHMGTRGKVKVNLRDYRKHIGMGVVNHNDITGRGRRKYVKRVGSAMTECFARVKA